MQQTPQSWLNKEEENMTGSVLGSQSYSLDVHNGAQSL